MGDLRVSFPKPCDEAWEAMAPAGCNRVCARCDKVIHDLSQYEFDEAEAILRRDDDACVRASVDANGVIALKASRSGALRRLVVAVGAAGLMAGGAPAFAKEQRPRGSIEGKVEDGWSANRVTATGADGKEFSAKVDLRGNYTIKHLPPGTYTLTFEATCGDSWKIENVAVQDRKTKMPATSQPDPCIIVGQLQIEDRKV